MEGNNDGKKECVMGNNVAVKRIAVYVSGLFFLALGVSLSIEAGYGVSPVSSLPVAITMSSAITVGITTVIANILFLLAQALLMKEIDTKKYALQLVIVFVFGFFIDGTLLLLQLFPAPESLLMRGGYLLLSFFLVALGLFGYFTSNLPLMPYDAMTRSLVARFRWTFGKAKITGDASIVLIAAGVCLTFTGALGAVGIGTVLAAYLVGKILGWMMTFFQSGLHNWIHHSSAFDYQKQEA